MLVFLLPVLHDRLAEAEGAGRGTWAQLSSELRPALLLILSLYQSCCCGASVRSRLTAVERLTKQSSV